MKLNVTLISFLTFLIAAAFLIASETEQVEEYDEDMYGPEDLIIWSKPVKGAVFSHKLHTMEAELDCDSCHDDLFEMEAGAAEEEDNFTMAAMYEGEYCGACHDGETAFASNTRCTLCHIGVRGVERVQGEKKTSSH